MQNKDEIELIARSLRGDTQAYGELVDRYKNAVYRHSFAIVRREDVAEDIAQETFITAFYKLAHYKNQYRLSTWLFKISTNKALNWLKAASREIAADDQAIASIVSNLPSPATQASYGELHAKVDKLRPNYRAVISLYYWQGLSYQEISLVLAVPVGSVRGWMNRAKQILRKELS